MPKIPATLTTERLRELASTGAEVTLARFRAEIIAIERTFPELRLPQRRSDGPAARDVHADRQSRRRVSHRDHGHGHRNPAAVPLRQGGPLSRRLHEPEPLPGELDVRIHHRRVTTKTNVDSRDGP